MQFDSTQRDNSMAAVSPLVVLRQMRTVVVAHKWLALALLLGVVVSGMVLTLLTPPVYEASIKVLVTRERVDPRISPGAASGDLQRPEIMEEEFNSELEIIRSREVIAAVVKELKLDQEPEKPAGRLDGLRKLYRNLLGVTETSALERAITKVGSSLEAVSVRKSRIIVVTYRDSDPERVASVLNTLYQKYADHHLNLHGSAQAANVFQSEAASFRDKLDAATEALKRFDARSGVVDANSQKDILLRQFYEMQHAVNAAQTERHELEQRLIAIKEQLAAQPEKIETSTVSKYVNALDKMKEEILTMELQRTQLLQKYKADSRFVRDVEQRITQAKAALAREEKNPPQERSVALNDIHRRLLNDLLTTQSSLATVREREKRLAAVATQYQQRLLEVDRRTFEKAELERTRAVNEEAYLLYQKKAQEADITKALNQQRIVNVNLAEAAQRASRPVSPKPLLNLAVLSVVGLLAALAGCFVAEKMNPYLRSKEQVQRRYRLKILAQIPDMANSSADN
ncbi:MAG TPA: GumC family protein [Blastocatellia bacterium]|nr:GumC family protein [Blastocatellia bacterium]